MKRIHHGGQELICVKTNICEVFAKNISTNLHTITGTMYCKIIWITYTKNTEYYTRKNTLAYGGGPKTSSTGQGDLQLKLSDWRAYHR